MKSHHRNEQGLSSGLSGVANAWRARASSEIGSLPKSKGTRKFLLVDTYKNIVGIKRNHYRIRGAGSRGGYLSIPTAVILMALIVLTYSTSLSLSLSLSLSHSRIFAVPLSVPPFYLRAH